MVKWNKTVVTESFESGRNPEEPKPFPKWIKVLGGAAVAVVLLITLLAIVVAMQPTDFLVTRSATMAAPPAKVFPEVNSFHAWEAWSPWAKIDPNAKAIFEGAEAGEGAKFTWSGNDEVGEGTQTIVESKPDERIRIRLDFERPMKATNDVEFIFKPEADKTHVTWNMRGKKDFVSKAFCMFFNMDKMVGGDFEKGLATLKAVVEKPAEGGAAKSDAPIPSEETKPTEK